MDDISFVRQSTIAEIIWILKTVLSGHSMRSNDDVGKIFAPMFPLLKSLYNFNLARTKHMYVIIHGLAPFFKSMLNDSLQKSNIHAFCFDETSRSSLSFQLPDLLPLFIIKRGYTDVQDGYVHKILE